MTIKKIFNCLSITILFVIVFPLFSYAQTTLGGNFLQLTLSPENPEPFQNVTIDLQSYTYDLDQSKITWSVNGVEKGTDMGLKEFSLMAGKNGQKTTVSVRVETPADGIQSTRISFVPSIVDLVYEALSYTPPFYKGKALNPDQGKVIVTAIPELINTSGQKISSKNIIFSWRKNDQADQVASGVGKDTYIFSGTVPIRDITIGVKVSSLDGSISASKQVNITNISPKIIFYENNPIYGIMFNRAIAGTIKMATDEFSVLAVPYFFSADTATAGSLDYVWSMNGQTVGNQSPKNSFTTRVDTAGSGTANIGLKISNNVRIFQFIDNSYNLSFSKQ